MLISIAVNQANQAKIVRLNISDLPELLALERQCFAYPWGKEQLWLALEQQMFYVFGLKDISRLLAYISYYHMYEEMEILNIAVRPEYRQQGLGRRLLRLVLRIGRKMGIQRVILEVQSSNVAARTLYARFGFTQVSLRKGYYQDNGDDALILAMLLTD
ncbi:(ribosomal protein S18)-alanine N-acetyltransferase [Desulfovibrionales bacterium]